MREPFLAPDSIGDVALMDALAAIDLEGYGPPYVKKRGRIRYPQTELEAWMVAEGIRRTTSAPGSQAGAGALRVLRGEGRRG